jgi:hypothetical protein
MDTGQSAEILRLRATIRDLVALSIIPETWVAREPPAIAFRRHAALIKRAFQDVSPEELQQLERILKKIGKRAEGLAEKPAPQLSLRETLS